MQDAPAEIILGILAYCDGKAFYRLRQACWRLAIFSDSEYFAVRRKIAEWPRTSVERSSSVFDTYCELGLSRRDPYRLLRSNIRIRLYEYFLRTRQNFIQVINRDSAKYRWGNYERIRVWNGDLSISILYGLRNLLHRIFINDLLYVDTFSYSRRQLRCDSNSWLPEHKKLAEEISRVVQKKFD
nr:hypothetical protein K-LCC10_0059 [Kaumoebavirus]